VNVNSTSEPVISELTNDSEMTTWMSHKIYTITFSIIILLVQSLLLLLATCDVCLCFGKAALSK